MGALCQQSAQHQDISDRSLDCLVMDTGNPASSVIEAPTCCSQLNSQASFNL